MGRALASRPDVGVAVVTYRAGRLLDGCLPPFLASPLRPRVLVVDSGSDDDTVARARALGAEVRVIPRETFNHGLTREAARRWLGTEIAVMVTPDVRPTGIEVLERLVAPILRGEAAVAYARQIARPDADPVERFGRDFAFPPEGGIRDRGSWARMGTAAHYCSDACCAWWQPALDAVGGFPPTLVSEETVAVVRLLERGYRVAYVAEAVVVHSHPSRLLADFRRQFDVGLTRTLHARELLARGGDEDRGRAYLRGLLARLAREEPAWIPYALLHTALRYAGYRLGRTAARWPRGLAARFSGQDYFWRSVHRERVLALAGGGEP